MKHENNIGLLRLTFASMVIVSHAYILLDRPMAEPLARYTDSFTLGSIGVDGFFILSGYLIAASMARSTSGREFFAKRILRIYPAFLVAYLVGGLIAIMVHPGYSIELWRSVFLFHPPETAAEGFGPLFTANAPMWTIAYEFRCYLGVMMLAAVGILDKRRRVLQLAAALWCLYVFIKIPVLWHIRLYKAPLPIDILVGNMLPAIRFFAIFSVGTVVYLYREEILPRLNGRYAALSLALIALTICYGLIGESLFMLLAAVIIFWLAFRVKLDFFQKINDRWDASYGTYLYGWPIGNLLVWIQPDWNVARFVLVNLIAAWIAGALSWFLLERHINLRRLGPWLKSVRGGV